MAKKSLSKYEFAKFIESLSDVSVMCRALEMQANYDRVIRKDEELIKLNRNVRFALEAYHDALQKRFDGISTPVFGFVMECNE